MDFRTVLSKIPFVSFSKIKETLEEYYRDMEIPFEVFPRWIAQTKLSNEEGSNHTSAYMVSADTELERKIIIGH